MPTIKERIEMAITRVENASENLRQVTLEGANFSPEDARNLAKAFNDVDAAHDKMMRTVYGHDE